MKLLFLLLFIVSINLDAFSGGEFIRVNEYKNISGFIGIDRLDNIYSIESGILIKHVSENEKLSYSRRSFGPVTYADVTDPLNILVFFGDFGHVVILDRNLAEKNFFSGSELWPGDVPQKVTYALQNGFWAYFAGSFRLVRFNNRGLSEIKSSQLILEHPEMGILNRLTESGNKLFVSANGMWVFDHHANFLFHIPEIQTDNFQIIGNSIFYLENGRLKVYDFFLHEENVFLLPETDVSSFFIKDNYIFLQTEVSLKKFHYTGNFY